MRDRERDGTGVLEMLVFLPRGWAEDESRPETSHIHLLQRCCVIPARCVFPSWAILLLTVLIAQDSPGLKHKDCGGSRINTGRFTVVGVPGSADFW